MSAIERLLKDFHFVEENKSLDEVETIYNPNEDVVIRIGKEYVEQIALVTDRSLPKLVQEFVVVVFVGIEDAEWYDRSAFDDVKYEIFRREQS